MTFRGKKVIGTIFYPVGLAIFLRNTKNLSCHEKKSSIVRKNASLINTKKEKKNIYLNIQFYSNSYKVSNIHMM